MNRYELVDLNAFGNNRGTTTRSELAAGAFNTWGNSFPTEELPARGSTIDVLGVPFRFATEGSFDNVRCARQSLPIAPGLYDWLYLLVAAERSTEDVVYLHFADGAVDREQLRVSSFWPEVAPWFGEHAAIACTTMHYPRHIQKNFGPRIWRGRIPVTREAPLRALRLPDNPAIHVFALTAIRSTVEEGT